MASRIVLEDAEVPDDPHMDALAAAFSEHLGKRQRRYVCFVFEPDGAISMVSNGNPDSGMLRELLLAAFIRLGEGPVQFARTPNDPLQ